MIFQLMHIMEFLNDTSCLSFQSWVFRIFIEVSMIKIAFVSLFSLTLFLIRTPFFYFMNINVENRRLWHNGRVIYRFYARATKIVYAVVWTRLGFRYTFFAGIILRERIIKTVFSSLGGKPKLLRIFGTNAMLSDMHPFRDKPQPLVD